MGSVKKKKEEEEERKNWMECSEDQRKKERKKKEKWRREPLKRPSKVAPHVCCSDCGTQYVGLLTEMPLKTESWKLKTHTHHSKIRELRDENNN